jgi:hypothetical protein
MNRTKETYYMQSAAIARASFYMAEGHSVSFYRDMQDGHRVWIVEWTP